MQKLLTLNELYVQYTDGLLTREAFEVAILGIIKNNVHRLCTFGWNSEEREDFVSSLYPRVSRAIDRYEKTGSSFEKYINTIVRFSAREAYTRAARSYVQETAAWITHIPEMYACENETEYDGYYGTETETAEKPAKLKNPRQLLILILKCCNHVTEDFLEMVSPRLNVRPETLSALINNLKKQREKRITEISLMRNKISSQLYRCIFYQKRLEELTENSNAAQQFKRLLEKGQIRLKKMRKRLTRARIDPSNLQIARLLGLSKGTVDAVMFTLKSRAARPMKALNKIPDYQKNIQ